MKLKVMINEGCVETVLADQEAMDADIELEVVDFNSDYGSDKEIYEKNFDEADMQDMSFSVDHCISE